MNTLVLVALTGLMTGAGLIVAIGPQNAYLLRQGVMRRHVVPIVVVCVVSDVVLIVGGVAGLGAVVTAWPPLITVAKIVGGLYVCALGVAALRRALRPSAMAIDAGPTAVSAASVVAATLALTWLNPHVYLDTVLMLGSVANSKGPQGRWFFAVGACLASLLWFSALGWGATRLAPLFSRPRAWQVLDAGIAVVMAVVGIGMFASV
ncbi:LysE/ArgO family amino acid transporter [Gordonia jinhuaensis]|uniref:Amino acid transporter n=1 Tax=Gordonia jinhuaensis TaxID=1517702 RepID=A0A916WZJ8_9ACTN|nr:LysE family transporter [Gordonia jinhuaensis]GGB44850.1 amino acid transporter [Gordonia jinhuaensis]